MAYDIKQILKDYWGYDNFRPMQREIIESVLAGNDTIGLLPTGGGKSLTFQIPALALEGLTVVVTPLISLMKDQVDNLRDRNIKAVYLHSGLTARENRLVYDRCRLGKAKLLYVSPEKISSKTFQDMLRTMTVSLIVVDEAHCISQWGYDFRPSYLKIPVLRKFFPSVPVLALTASATPEVIDDIAVRLEMKRPAIFKLSFARQNLSYIVRYCDYKEGKILEILSKISGTAIVYTRSRKRTRELANFLKSEGISADYYHAGLLPQEKEEKQNAWKSGEIRVIVATNAFGMGIDKPDVRVVIHNDLPSSLEEYYQEAGRAGRDGKPSLAVLVVSRADKALLSRRLTESFPGKDVIRKVYEQAGNFLDVAVGEGFNRLFEFNLGLFCKTFDVNPVVARNSLQILTNAGYIEYNDEMSTGSRVMILMVKGELYDIRLSVNDDKVLQSMLRTYTGLFSDYTYINEKLIAIKTELTEEDVYQSLLSLTRQHVIHYIPRTSSPFIFFSTSREEPRHLLFPKEIYELRREKMRQRIDAVKQFAFDPSECRVSTLLKYFGEEVSETCGGCDVCRSKKQSAGLQTTERIIAYLTSQPNGQTLEYILSQTGPNHKATIECLRSMVDRGEVTLVDGRYIRS